MHYSFRFFSSLAISGLFVLLFCCPAFAQVTKPFDQRSIVRGERPPIDLSTIQDDAFEPGVVVIKFSDDFAPQLELNPPQQLPNGKIGFFISELDHLIDAYGVNEAREHFSFPALNNGFLEKHKAWGFHLWYKLKFDERFDVKAFILQLEQIEAIAVAELEYKKMHIGVEFYKPGKENNIKGSMLSPEWTPNDPQLSNQWHYNNTGQVGGTPGADISLFAAWDIEKGNSDVIVAIVDDGIQFSHPDIAGNMWSGIGYNFVAGNSTVVPGNHGTHVAGTVAAVNNNTTGVAGVAGGSGSADGVRLMSCQVFTSSSSGGFHLAPVWAADNGASISQNSWGYTSVGVYEQSVLDAIDYFNANGGGNAMNGGITIFAAGNSNASGAWYPGFYSGAFAVAATNNQDVRSYYSNYGPWIDVSAPGGETNSVNARGVLSTVTGSSFAYYQGTSMACPHTSGLAALIISHAYGQLTPGDVANIIRNSADNHYGVNPGYIGQLGTGRINAHQALIETQAYLSGILNPASFSANALGPSEIELIWNKNPDNHDVMVAWSPGNVFGTPDSLVSYQPGDSIPGGGIVLYAGSANGINHSGLEPATHYFYRAWSFTGTYHYSPGRPASAITSCEIFQLPFGEDFETFQMLPLCWDQETITGSTSWKTGAGNAGTNPPNAYNGSSNVYFKEQGLTSTGFTTRLISPVMNIASYDNVELRFWYTNSLRTFLIWNFQDILRVKYKNTATAEWQLLATFNTNVSNWTEVIFQLPDASDTYYIAFEAESGLGHGVCIDHVTIVGEGGVIIHTILATAGDNGMIDPSGQISVIENDDQTFVIVADTGYSIGSLMIDALTVPEAEGLDSFNYTFSNVTQNHTISASFALNVYSIEISVDPENAGVAEGYGEYSYNEVVELLAIPLYGYEFSNWTEDGMVISTANFLTFPALSDRMLQANFTFGTWSINVTVDPSGTGTVQGSGEYFHTSTVELQAIPDENYAFTGWFENNQAVATENPYSFTADGNRNLTAKFQLIGASVSTVPEEQILIYPNPSSGKFNIEVFEPVILKLFNYTGKMIYSSAVEKGIHAIYISGHESGLYFMQAQYENRPPTIIKLIVE